ncbi:hypothetical protein ICN84_01610 [Akkermansia glycaniphila]|uniref:putative peptidoglycan-binding domain-containing protein n=1 Tax=Akkermansia glycaniphila TaxID=1679444 RepID=UPI001C031DEA|nr:putative peptidoglycan-binding domain-containing protein [Akkermansia glycaniphila]MBT9448767.1 hypothetical protein [Akkermansia glycaniphila]
MSTIEQKRNMGRAIVNFEARRDKNGHLAVYRMPAGDGGGEYEVAGINNGYHPGKARQLRNLIEAGQYEQAEREAADYIVEYTASAGAWLAGMGAVPEFYLRDTCFNAGPGGAARVLQMAVGAAVDGKVGPKTLDALSRYFRQHGSRGLLDALHVARWDYMEEKASRPSKKQFWKGWQNRMNNALKVAATI